MDLLTREELETKKARILSTWDGFEQLMQEDHYCCHGCKADAVWGTYGEEGEDAWLDLVDILRLLGEI